ncbi:MAG: glycosyltransferase [Dehalococcoidia bacterium]|nr:glycosyltransferase [Dehalococcoidia bacterium]
MSEHSGTCLVSISYTRAGTEEVLLDLARCLVRDGEPVSAIVPGERALDGLANDLVAAGAVVVRAGRFFGEDVSLVRNVRDLRKALRALRPAVVHVHTPWVGIGKEAVVAAWLAGVPYRLRTEQNPVPDPLRLRQRLSLKLSDRLVQGISFVSSGNRESHLRHAGRPRRKCMVVPNAVRPAPEPRDRATARAELGLPLDALVAVMVGRLERRKGPLDFVRAAAVAAKAAPGLHFAIAGDGEMHVDIEAAIAAAGLEERIHLLGHRPNIRALLPAFDIFVQPSHYEGLSVAMLEALAAGLPMATTDVDGVAEVAPGGDGALIVPIGDTDALGEAVARLANDAELRRALANTTRRRIEREFTVEATYARYRRFYALATGKRGTPGTRRREFAR